MFNMLDEENNEDDQNSEADESDDESGLDSDELEDNDSDSGDDLASDNTGGEEDSDEDSEDDVRVTDPGSIVWVCWGSRWYPAKVVLLADVPEPIRSSLRRDSGKSVVVMFYGDDDYGRIDVKKIDQLGATNLDLKRSRFPGIILKYNLASGDLTGCNFLCSGFRICSYGFRFLTITL